MPINQKFKLPTISTPYQLLALTILNIAAFVPGVWGLFLIVVCYLAFLIYDSKRKCSGEPQSRDGRLVRKAMHLNSQISQAIDAEEVLCLLERLHEFDTINMVTVLYRFGRLGDPRIFDDPRVNQLLHAILRELSNPESFRRGGISNMAWAFGKLHLRAQGVSYHVVLKLASQAISDVKTLTNPELTSIAWAFSSIIVPAPCQDSHDLLFQGKREWRELITQYFMDLSVVALNRLDEFSNQELSNTALAFCRGAKMGQLSFGSNPVFEPMLKFLAALALECRRRVGFSSQHLANVCWAFCKLGCLSADDKNSLYDSIAHQVLQLDSLKPQEISNICYSFAKANVRREDLFDFVAVKALESIDSFGPQDFANMVWAYATLNLRTNSQVFNQMGKIVIHKFNKFKSQELSNILWGFCRVRPQRVVLESMFIHGTNEMLRSISRQSTQALVTVAHSSVKAELHLPDFIRSTVNVIHSRLATTVFKPQELSNMAWLLARMQNDQTYAAFLTDACDVAMQMLPKFKHQELANLLWGSRQCGVLQHPIYAAAVHRIQHIRSLRKEEWMQFQWVYAQDGMPQINLDTVLKGR